MVGSDGRDGRDMLVVQCPNCELYQGAQPTLFGRKLKTKTCVSCRNKIDLKAALPVYKREVQATVRRLNGGYV